MNLSDREVDGYIITHDPLVEYSANGKYYNSKDEEVTPTITRKDAEIGMKDVKLHQMASYVEAAYAEGMSAIRKMEGTNYDSIKVYSEQGVKGDLLHQDAIALATALGVIKPVATDAEKQALSFVLAYGEFEKAVKDDLIKRLFNDEKIDDDLLSWRQRNYVLSGETASEEHLNKLYTEFGLSKK